MHDVIKSLKGLEINSIKDKFKRHFNKLNHAAQVMQQHNETLLEEFNSVRRHVEAFEKEMWGSLDKFQEKQS